MLLRLWLLLPVAARAVMTVFLVMLAGSLLPQILLAVNLEATPRIPWAAGLVPIHLWLVWQYLKGRGAPRTTARTRLDRLTAAPLSRRLWRWSLLSGAFMGVGLRMLLDLGRRLSPRPGEGLSSPEELAAAPPATVAAFLLATSLIAGVVEEAAFRGYLQRPIEVRHGPVAAVVAVAAAFMLAHVQPGAPNPLHWLAIAPAYLLGSAAFSVLVLLTRSIVPGILVHVAVDVAGLFQYWLLGVPPSVWISGADAGFKVRCGLLVAAAARTIWAYRALARVAREERVADPRAAEDAPAT
jgi:membrane protease YdiL (CAAX protease family)